jgi:hypothetical protein
VEIIFDLINDVFWMLPFSKVRQAKRVRTNIITKDVWNTSSPADHSPSNVRTMTDLEQRQKEVLVIKGGAAAAASTPASKVRVEVEYDDAEE